MHTICIAQNASSFIVKPVPIGCTNMETVSWMLEVTGWAKWRSLQILC